jgi:cytochrome c6
VLLTITSTGKVTLLLVAGTFIAWAFITAILIPGRRPDFPRNVASFVTVSALLFAAQMGAVYWVTATQEVEAEAATGTGTGTGGGDTTAPAATTPAATTPTETAPAAAGGDAAAGKSVFATVGCTDCHTLADAGSNGNVGPNLDDVKPPFDLVVTRVTEGKGVMPSFKGRLSAKQIKDVAAYVSSVAGS